MEYKLKPWTELLEAWLIQEIPRKARKEQGNDAVMKVLKR